ncbi:MAG: DUF5009 domain-containing protein [Ignavibacteriales bacterium]|nr:DUF5009 domain-containing protein [Ignavibacteriales bacterium]
MSSKLDNRLLSLDILRGITIAGMIMVNNPGSWATIYPPLAHAKWHGCTPTDLVFPFFLFIVGVAVTFSLSKRKDRGDNQNKLLMQVFRRSLMLIAVGLFMAAFPFFDFNTFTFVDLSKLRFPGVLQRIGLVYFFASFIFLKCNIQWQAILGGSFLLLYWFLMMVVPVPGVGYPNLMPTTNLAAYIDNLILSGHMWGATKVWDPEGLLSTLPAISTAISGMLLGHWLRTDKDPVLKTVWIFIAASFAMAIGWLWDLNFPMNKSIWTSSYVVFTSGLALQFFGVCYWLVDIKGYQKWAKPFIIYGTNAITVFVLSGLLAKLMNIIKFNVGSQGEAVALKTIIYDNLYLSWLSPYNASFAFAITYILFWLGIMTIFYKKGIFIKI